MNCVPVYSGADPATPCPDCVRGYRAALPGRQIPPRYRPAWTPAVCASAEPEFPSDKVYRRDDCGIIGIESLSA